MKEIRIRCWLEHDGQKFFGPGPYQLMNMIDRKGSISLAAKEMNMSYKKAWDMIHRINEISKSPVIVSQKGGKMGGGAEVTPFGKEVLLKYEQLVEKLNQVVEVESELRSLFEQGI
ncbi:winged helix-turn-helix domain-containing protein [Algoriphagus pacificus]|uniref:Winged helix-turn-helix domain-containing protein n=1 Tax=Algoriphagus pacificus TaxID=2811234 RepID=A0ABS3CIS8_9BACT|nr:winged helix-turn-helix domain-containing protein [Algoriphagus pacificus]MBN7817002.1 winged helix-turn-helix domain-containing protein [Algoriphagus pacificus]